MNPMKRATAIYRSVRDAAEAAGATGRHRVQGWTAGALALLALTGRAQAGEEHLAMNEATNRPAILLVAFGSTMPETRRTFDEIERDVREAFPGQAVARAFTSSIVRERLAAQGETVPDPQAALDALLAQGAKEVVLQSLHVMPGEEFQDLFSLNPRGLRLRIGAPLLGDNRDLEEVCGVLDGLCRPDRPNVVAAHGNEKRPHLNAPLLKLAARIETRRSDTVLATIDGPPGLDPLERLRPRVAQTGGVHFVPLMLISGVHVRDDLMGPDRESWKNRLGARDATVAPALGDLPAVRALLVRHIREARPVGSRTDSLMSAGGGSGGSAFDRWKRRLPFWPRKAVLFLQLALVVTAGVFVGQLLEQLNLVRVFSLLARPLTTLGRLPEVTAPPFFFAFQSGAVANGMLVNLRDNGVLDARALFSSVFVVSSLSLFAHLPTYIVPLGMAFGWAATGALFGVRLTAIALQLTAVLLTARFLARRSAAAARTAAAAPAAAPAPAGSVPARTAVWPRVWRGSWRTVRRLLIYLLPTFVLTAWIESSGFFTWLTAQAPGLFRVGGLPAESAAVIGAQAVNLYNGAILAATYVDAGAVTTRQAILILLAGTMLTAPIRTLKHSMSTYIAVLGVRPGVTMAVATQLSRSLFLLPCTVALALIWR
jgi:cobalamin biosynthesis Co2+ chelatase CbiK